MHSNKKSNGISSNNTDINTSTKKLEESNTINSR